MPATAVAIQMAAADTGSDNFSVLLRPQDHARGTAGPLGQRRCPGVGLLLPGHVTTIIGPAAFEFHPPEISASPARSRASSPWICLLGVESILSQIARGPGRGGQRLHPGGEGSRPTPGPEALLAEVFAPEDAAWRGLGVIPGSGVGLGMSLRPLRRPAPVSPSSGRVPHPAAAVACRCGEVLRGVLRPGECPLFDRTCTPSQPLGPCMVSSEGACAAAYRYERG